MMRRSVVLLPLLASLAACGGRARGADAIQPAPVVGQAEAASANELDSTWARAEHAYRRGKWTEAGTQFERFLLEAGPGDPRATRGRFYVAETKLANGERLEAARDFRRVSDETPNDSLAPDALLRVGDAYAEMWRRPELDPSYGQTALATYQELLSRYPNTAAAQRSQTKIAELENWFAFKQYKSAMYYIRLKAYDSAILYLKDLVATYPKAQVAPDALLRLVEAYRNLGYMEDAAEACGYLLRFHAGAHGVAKTCPHATPAQPAPATPAKTATADPAGKS